MLDIDYDAVVYDTYDFLDKVISLSLADPLCAAFDLYHQKTNDGRARIIQNLIRYGTNDPADIWLLRYGFDPEDLEWLGKYLEHIDAFKIEFKDSIHQESKEKLALIGRYL